MTSTTTAPGFPLDVHRVYRVSLPDDPAGAPPQARLCIGPRPIAGGSHLAFFDTLRERVLKGGFVVDERAPRDAVCFQVEGGARLWIEPLTLPRWREIQDRIDGRPEFDSDEALRRFYIAMVE